MFYLNTYNPASISNFVFKYICIYIYIYIWLSAKIGGMKRPPRGVRYETGMKRV